MNKRNNITAEVIPTAVVRARLNKAYKQESRQSMEEKWILGHLPLVKHIVKKIMFNLGGKFEREDLISAGTLGLVKAAQGFDSAKGVEFKTYAYIRIRGAIIDELRSQSFVPAAVHNNIRMIRETFQNLTTQMGSPPTDSELAAAVKMPLPKMYKTLEEARKQNFMSIHGLVDDKPAFETLMPSDGNLSPDKIAEKKETLENLTNAITELPQRDRHVLLLYYERDLTMKETAEVLGVTESRVSQLHASALFKLAMKFEK